MDYIIIALKDGKELLGTDNSKLVHDCKSLVKVKNALSRFNPSKEANEIYIYSYTNLYDDKTYKLYKSFTYNKIN